MALTRLAITMRQPGPCSDVVRPTFDFTTGEPMHALAGVVFYNDGRPAEAYGHPDGSVTYVYTGEFRPDGTAQSAFRTA